MKMGALKSWTVIVVSASVFIITCVTILQFIFFLSRLPENIKEMEPREAQQNGDTQNITELHDHILQGGKSIFSSVVMSVITNVTLVCVFILQHSFLIQPIKIIANKLGVPVLERSFYNFAACVALLTLIFCWKRNTSYVLWYVDVQNNHTLRTAYISIHTVTWLIIYVGIICMDVTELFGIKQVFQYFRDSPKPQEFKSKGLLRFQRHMRHPSLIGFLIILWVFPFMSFDRLLLASLWSVYMVIAWKPDIRDYNYLIRQQLIKRIL